MNILSRYEITLILVASGTTLLLRALPFLLLKPEKKASQGLRFIGKALPPAVIAMLCIYCFSCYFRDRPPMQHMYGLAEIAAGALTVILHLWRHNSMLSILGGTALYMVLVQTITP